MIRSIHDPVVQEQIRQAVRDDFENSDLRVPEIAARHNVCVRSVYVWCEGLKRKKYRSDNPDRYTTILLTDREVEILSLAVQETEKIYSGDILRRLTIMEDRLADIADELRKRSKHTT